MSELTQTIIIGFNPARLRGEPEHRSDLIRSLIKETNLEANNKSDCKKIKPGQEGPRRAKKLNLSTTIENNIWNRSWRDSIIPWTTSLRAYQRPWRYKPPSTQTLWTWDEKHLVTRKFHESPRLSGSPTLTFEEIKTPSPNRFSNCTFCKYINGIIYLHILSSNLRFIRFFYLWF